jgi:hypothetical protein
MKKKAADFFRDYPCSDGFIPHDDQMSRLITDGTPDDFFKFAAAGQADALMIYLRKRALLPPEKIVLLVQLLKTAQAELVTAAAVPAVLHEIRTNLQKQLGDEFEEPKTRRRPKIQKIKESESLPKLDQEQIHIYGYVIDIYGGGLPIAEAIQYEKKFFRLEKVFSSNDLIYFYDFFYQLKEMNLKFFICENFRSERFPDPVCALFIEDEYLQVDDIFPDYKKAQKALDEQFEIL